MAENRLDGWDIVFQVNCIAKIDMLVSTLVGGGYRANAAIINVGGSPGHMMV